jgi:hypothetical protein
MSGDLTANPPVQTRKKSQPRNTQNTRTKPATSLFFRVVRVVRGSTASVPLKFWQFAPIRAAWSFVARNSARLRVTSAFIHDAFHLCLGVMPEDVKTRANNLVALLLEKNFCIHAPLFNRQAAGQTRKNINREIRRIREQNRRVPFFFAYFAYFAVQLLLSL